MRAGYAQELLETRKIKVTSPLEFNDVLEYCPRPSGAPDPGTLVSSLKSNLRRRQAYGKLRELGVFSGTFEEYEAWIVDPKQLLKIAESLAKEHPERVLKECLSFRKDYALDLLVLCLSKDFDNQLMWSHYSDSHRGCVVELDFSVGLASKFASPVQMTYGTERIQLVDNWAGSADPDNPEVMAFIHDLTAFKSDVWSYENEYRWFLLQEHCVERDGL
ncbi:MAG: DUF2971 domain-containing protein [Opitutales bacterium]